MKYIEGGEPFVLGEGGAGILTFHGFTGSPYEVRALGELLHQSGFGVYGAPLAGHATDVAELEKTTAEDYLLAGERAFDEASRRFERVYIVGLSVGGTVGLHLAVHKPVAGIVTISTPVFLYPMMNATLPLIEQWLPGLRAPANFAAWQGNVVGYKSTTIGAVNVILDVLARVRKELEEVTAPLLVVHSARDLTVPVDSAREIYNRASSKDKRLELIGAGSHLMTIGPNLQLIDSFIVEFLKRLESNACPEGR
ncbi:MAG TPA: alpha/beta fold hydrolase [Candidatus Eremiobacteraceae bacterium]|nr:alpha/beta fold hydrolase [Candidatus Eremiobacteraceae bacterium]